MRSLPGVQTKHLLGTLALAWFIRSCGTRQWKAHHVRVHRPLRPRRARHRRLPWHRARHHRAPIVAAGAHVVTCARSAVEALDARHVPPAVRRPRPRAVHATVDAVVAEHGRLDVLVNNAGGAPYALAADASPRFHDKILGLNLTGPLRRRAGGQRRHAAPGARRRDRQRLLDQRPAPVARHRGVRRREGRPRLADHARWRWSGRPRCGSTRSTSASAAPS